MPRLTYARVPRSRGELDKHTRPGQSKSVDRLRWKQADLLRGAEPGPWDFVLWRNMAIYLEPRTAGRIWEDLLHALAPGGYLVTGKTDHAPRLPHLEKLAPCIYRKTRTPA